MKININNISTELRNENTKDIDVISYLDGVKLINKENEVLSEVLRSCEVEVATCVEKVTEAFKRGGRLIYIGAGTSGRMGVLDASECVPTFGVESTQVVGIIAGGDRALRDAIENAEDNFEMGQFDLEHVNLSERDVVIGLSASGRTPYVRGALTYANKVGAFSVSIAHSFDCENSRVAKLAIEAVTGPEVLRGSTRLKAGTATKLILNTISTLAMIHIGKSYSNYMVDVKTSNEKLFNRAINMIMEITNCSEQIANDALVSCDSKVKNAIVCILLDVDYNSSIDILETNGSKIRNLV